MDPIELNWSVTVLDVATGIEGKVNDYKNKETAMKKALMVLFEKLEQNTSAGMFSHLHIFCGYY